MRAFFSGCLLGAGATLTLCAAWQVIPSWLAVAGSFVLVASFFSSAFVLRRWLDEPRPGNFVPAFPMLGEPPRPDYRGHVPPAPMPAPAPRRPTVEAGDAA